MRTNIILVLLVMCLFSNLVFAVDGDMGGPTQDGSADHPYLIEDFNDFQAFCADPNYWAEEVHTRMDCNLDLDPNLPDRIIYDQAPIASRPSRKFYAGCFNGNEHVISNLAVSGPGYISLFGRTQTNSEIKNLGLENVSINSTSDFAAPLAGYSFGDVNNCYATGDVNGTYQIAGLIGYNNGGSIADCYATCNVTGDIYVGGLVASSNGGSITNCYSTGDVNALGDYAAGLVGNNTNGNITDCHTTGNVNALGDYAAGLVGNNSGSNITNCYATGLVSTPGDHAGGLVGYNNNGDITDCYATGDVKGYSGIGGLIGFNDGNVNNCFTKGNVNGSNYIAALVGHNDGTINNCYATGVLLSGYNSVAGIAGCNDYNGSVTNCYSTCRIYDYRTGIYDYMGAVVGKKRGTTSNCFWDVYTTRIPDPQTGGPDKDGMIGLTTELMQTQSTFTDAGWDFINETANGTEDIWQMPAGYYPRFSWETLSTAIGSPSNPFLITDFDDFQQFCNDPNCWASGFYTRLEADIDLDTNLPGRVIYDKAPIAGDTDNTNNYIFDGIAYAGHFEGGGHVISNLTVDGEDFIGLFGYIGINSQIKNLGLENISITGNDYVGGLMGYDNDGIIINCYAAGNVDGNVYIGGLIGHDSKGNIINCYSTGNIKGGYWAGGLIGDSYKSIITNCYSTGNVYGGGGLISYSDSCIITNCYATGDVNAPSYAAGLIRYNFESTITNCYATGNVTALSYSAAGLVQYNTGGTIINCYYSGDVNCPGNSTAGLVAVNRDNSSIIGCYSLGTVYGNDSVGGLVGSNIEDCNIINCYSVATVEGSGFVGGLVGYNEGNITNCYSAGYVDDSGTEGGLVGNSTSSGIITNCFWDKNTSGESTSDGGTGLTTAQMKIQSIFTDAGWDFIIETANGDEDIWQMPDGYRPRLAWEIPPVNPYLINDYNDFKEFCSDKRYWESNITAILQADIDLDPNLPGRVVYDKAPIGCIDGYDPYYGIIKGVEFSGHFDGNGYVISNLTIQGEYYCGLFGKTTTDSTIENIAMFDTTINNNNGKGYYVAPLVSYNSGNITNCYTENSNINANGYASALVGFNMGNITNCHSNNSEVFSSYSCTSSLVGSNGDYLNNIGGASITDCYSTMGIIDGGSYTGGLAGTNYRSEIINCYSTCEINNSDRNTGGLIGFNYDALILDSWSEGSTTGIYSSYNVGGLVGFNYRGEIKNCYANQTVSGAERIGGLIGGNNNGAIVNCHSTGTATTSGYYWGDSYVGGLIGENSGNIESCYSTAGVSGIERYVGGLIGYHSSGEINNCYATGEVTGSKDYVGGLAGYNSGSRITNCYSGGDVSGNDYVGGLTGKGGIWDNCYSVGKVNGSGSYVGALMGEANNYITNCFWDVNSSMISDPEVGVPDTDGMIGKTTTEMQMQSTFTDTTWDFVSESLNGDEDIWRMCVDGVEYPKFWWEFATGDFVCGDGVDIVDFAVLADTWNLSTGQSGYNYKYDLADDGVIDFADLAIFCDNWLGGI